MALLLFEVGMRLAMPQDLDFYNLEKFRRRSSRPGQAYELIPNSASDSYIGVPVQINNLGLRDRDVAVPKSERVLRVLVLGDSVTFGFGVRLEETYVKRLESRLNAWFDGSTERVEVINAGAPSTGLNYYYHFLQTKGAQLAPDLVLVGITLNDISDYEEGHRGRSSRESAVFWPLFYKLNRALLLHSHLYHAVYMNLKSIFYRTRVLDINKTHDYDFLTLKPPSERQAHAWSSSLALLRQFVELARGLKVPVVLVVFPMEVQLSAPALDLYRRELGVKLDVNAVTGAPQRRLAEFARVHGVPLIDLLPRFRESHTRALFLRNQAISHDWVHPSREGHELAAEEIFRGLRATELFSDYPR